MDLWTLGGKFATYHHKSMQKYSSRKITLTSSIQKVVVRKNRSFVKIRKEFKVNRVEREDVQEKCGSMAECVCIIVEKKSITTLYLIFLNFE